MAVQIVEARALGPQMVRGTVLFADLRGYTTLAERLSPVAVVTLLDEFFAILAHAIEHHGGTVFHSAGDSLMAGFGLDDASDAPLLAAVEAGRQIVSAFGPVSARWERFIGVSTGVGVGLHVGELAIAELGPASFRRTTLIGDTVNVAARLCQRARAGEVLFSGSIAEPIAIDAVDGLLALPELMVRGRATPVRIFCVPARARVTLERAAGDAPAPTAHVGG